MPGPDIPQFVWDDMGDRTEWPLLDAVTASALEEYCDNNLFPKETVFMLGEYLSSSLSMEEIKLWIPIVSEDSLESYRIPLCRPHAEFVGYLTNVFIELSMIWANDFRLEDFAGRIMRLTVEELKHVAEEAGLAGTGSKAELMLRLIEHCYSDMLVSV